MASQRVSGSAGQPAWRHGVLGRSQRRGADAEMLQSVTGKLQSVTLWARIDAEFAFFRRKRTFQSRANGRGTRVLRGPRGGL
jgi:hypothetical protein